MSSAAQRGEPANTLRARAHLCRVEKRMAQSL
jgi:hypothetical protein